MAICSKCRKRLIFWISLTGLSIGIGLLLDMVFLRNGHSNLVIRLAGLAGMILVHFLLKRTGKLLSMFGECELWGWSTKLILNNVYKCIRHPHHLGVGLFMTFLGLLIGYPITFLIIFISQWLWVILFVIFIEEKECLDKFGEDYKTYRKNVPMFFGNPVCIIKELLKSINK